MAVLSSKAKKKHINFFCLCFVKATWMFMTVEKTAGKKKKDKTCNEMAPYRSLSTRVLSTHFCPKSLSKASSVVSISIGPSRWRLEIFNFWLNRTFSFKFISVHLCFFASRRELPKVHSSSVCSIDIAFLFLFSWQSNGPSRCLFTSPLLGCLSACLSMVACPPYVLCCHLCDPCLWPKTNFPFFSQPVHILSHSDMCRQTAASQI